MREVTVAVAQLAPELARVGENLKRMVEIVDLVCRDRKVDLIVFPELITTGYECGVRFTDLAERVPGPAVNIIAEQARDYHTHIAFGLVEKITGRVPQISRRCRQLLAGLFTGLRRKENR